MSHLRALVLLVGLPAISAGCYAAATEAGRIDLVRNQATKDLNCPADQLTISPEPGFTYRVEGCGRRSFQEVVCIEGDCQAESKLTEAPVADEPMLGKAAPPRRLVNPGAEEEEMPMPNRLAVIEQPYAGTFRVCVTPAGVVDDVQVVKSTGREEVDKLWRAKLLTWRFEPRAYVDAATPLCQNHTISYDRSPRRPPERLTPAQFAPM